MKVYIKKFLKHYYVMLVPAFLWLIFFSIVPMFGIIMAFEDYNPGLGMLKSPFIGLENFRYMLQISDVRQAIVNRCGEDYRQYHRAAYLCDPAE